jgi:outer membrane protein insertion porin family
LIYPVSFRFKKNFQTEPNHPRWYQVIGNFSPIRSYEYLSRFINPEYLQGISRFKRKEYEDDKKKVLDYYLSKGYRDARIVSDTVYKLDQKNLAIRLRVDEGRQYYFRNIEWRGNTKYSDSLLSRILGVKRGDIY